MGYAHQSRRKQGPQGAAEDKVRHETEMAAYNKRKEEEKAAGAPA